MSTKYKNLIHAGTSGWHYQHWKGNFYPEDLSETSLLEYYSGHFDTVEINNSFYRLPEKETLERWRESVPDKFVFSVKASRYITHLKKLQDAEKTVLPFLKRVAVLQEKLGPILFQLPPRWHCNLERLKEFLTILPAEFRYAIEFRDPSWLVNGTWEALAEAGAAFCIHDLDGLESPLTVTGDYVYVRLHGPGEAYRGNYDAATLLRWAGNCSMWVKQGREVYVYFDNDEAGYAAKNAGELKAIIKTGYGGRLQPAAIWPNTNGYSVY